MSHSPDYPLWKPQANGKVGTKKRVNCKGDSKSPKISHFCREMADMTPKWSLLLPQAQSVYVWLCVCAHVYVSMYVCMCVHMCLCMFMWYTLVYVCMFAYVQVHMCTHNCRLNVDIIRCLPWSHPFLYLEERSLTSAATTAHVWASQESQIAPIRNSLSFSLLIAGIIGGHHAQLIFI